MNLKNYRQTRFAELTKQNLERDGISIDLLVHRQIDRELDRFKKEDKKGCKEPHTNEPL